MNETTTPTTPAAKGQQVKSSLPKHQPTQIIFRLINENPIIKGRTDVPRYPPYISLKNTDTIVWTDEKTGERYDRSIRYLTGYESVFVDEQEKNGRVISQNILENPANKFEIISGEMKFRPSEKAKILFSRMRNANADSEYRTGRVTALYSEYSEAKEIAIKKEKQELQKEAFEKAYKVSDDEIIKYSQSLNISLVDETGATRVMEAIATDFREIAIENPKQFLEVVK